MLDFFLRCPLSIFALLRNESENKSNPKPIREKAATLLKGMERTIFWSTIATESKIMNAFDKVFKILQADDVDFDIIRPLVTSLIASLESNIPEDNITIDVENELETDPELSQLVDFIETEEEEEVLLDDDLVNESSEELVNFDDDALKNFGETLFEKAEEALKSGEHEITFNGLNLTVSKAQVMGMKCLRNKLIKNTSESLKRRFLNEEIEILKDISKILSPRTNPNFSLEHEIDFLAKKYTSSVDKKVLHAEIKILTGLKKSYTKMNVKTFAGIIVANYLQLIPQCCFLAQIYLLAPIQNAVVERVFSLQNIILSQRRSQLKLSSVFCKVFLKYCKFFMSEKEIKKIIESAAITWCTTKTRRRGAGKN